MFYNTKLQYLLETFSQNYNLDDREDIIRVKRDIKMQSYK